MIFVFYNRNSLAAVPVVFLPDSFRAGYKNQVLKLSSIFIDLVNWL
jgi:hypothetical protein